MREAIAGQVIDFYAKVFGRLFSRPFRTQIADPLKRRAVVRQVEEAADAASQSLTRFFLSQKLREREVGAALEDIARPLGRLKPEDVANPNVTPEAVVGRLLAARPARQGALGPVSAVALHSAVQVLMLVGPVMAEWQKLNFSSGFELPGRLVSRLNQISAQLDAIVPSGEAGADEDYEIQYRDYLLQRFYRVEAGTVRMTTNLDVDLRELFVMPRVRPRPLPDPQDIREPGDAATLMDLAAARKIFARAREDMPDRQPQAEDPGIPALEQVSHSLRTVIVGFPGSGKSTFFEWLQLRVAGVEEPLPMAGEQAIPLLLRVRQLDPRSLPRGAALIEKATESRDRVKLMPQGWVERQMKAGRVLFMLDGLDETEPKLRDRYVLPWLAEICKEYPECAYLMSSRPVGYPPGTLRLLEFTECNLLDFDKSQIAEYARHWCTAVRLARNEPAEEARREGAEDGNRICEGFKDHPHICNLARNPLMLSAVCLVNYFEGSQLPKDRLILYRLCVEGLLHHWDQRRGLHSEFALAEKLRVCRELALEMQAGNRAEYEADKVQRVFAEVLGQPERAGNLLEHVRYRTGLLLERRPGIFAFAHLAFQEYLAALAVQEGNRAGVDADQLVREHEDGRWEEVIALYCGMAPSPAVRALIERLIVQPDSRNFSTVLGKAYLSARAEVLQDPTLRRRVSERIAVAPASVGPSVLSRFPAYEVAPIANSNAGRIQSEINVSEAYRWLVDRPDKLDADSLARRLSAWHTMTLAGTAEASLLLHAFAPDRLLSEVASQTEMYSAAAPFGWACQAEIALLGLDFGFAKLSPPPQGPGSDAARLAILRALSKARRISQDCAAILRWPVAVLGDPIVARDPATRSELASLSLARAVAARLPTDPEGAAQALNEWASSLERTAAEQAARETGPPAANLTGDTPHDP